MGRRLARRDGVLGFRRLHPGALHGRLGGARGRDRRPPREVRSGRARQPGANLPLATLGAFVLWFGWFGFNGGSQRALGSALDASAMAIVYVNTNLAAAAGVVVAMLLTQALYKKMDLTLCLNGAIGGLVAAGPDLQHHGIAMAASAALRSRFRCRCSTGSGSTTWSARFPPICGIWGTLAVGIFDAGAFLVQLAGVAAVGAFVFAVSLILWTVLKVTIGVRPGEEAELAGLDQTELGLEAYSAADRRSADASPRRPRTAPWPLSFV